MGQPRPERLRAAPTRYDFTHQIRRNDFDQAKDSFDYRAALDAATEEAFVSACRAQD